jgi:hypothetical protein
MIVSALVTGATLKATGIGSGTVKVGKQAGTAQAGDVAAASRSEIEARIAELETRGVNNLTTKEAQELQLLQKELHEASRALGDPKMHANTSTTGRFGPSVEKMLSAQSNAASSDEVRVWFRVVIRGSDQSVQVQAFALSTERNITFLHMAHTSADSLDPAIRNTYLKNGEYGISGDCQNVTAAGLTRVFHLSVTPFMLTNNWSTMASVGFYGFYGVHGALFFDAAEQYYYERATQ